VQIALRTQQIIAHESGAANTVDPLGGSYLIEHLTDEIERRACELIDRIDAMGGAMSAIEAGFINREIQDAAYRAQQEVESKEQIVVGVNAFTVDEETSIEKLRIDPGIEAAQRDRLALLRAGRDNQRVSELLGQLDGAARGGDALMPLFVTCVEHDVTLGEICGVLRKVFGEYRPEQFV
jgi:methylmalonyl-CoA mutase N-terminal domain/subunit